jgi:carboxypeptidase Taq
MSSAYENLVRRFHEVALLSSSAGVLSWDQETNMPQAAADFRAEQMAFLEGQAHRLATAPEIGEWQERLQAPWRPRICVVGGGIMIWP